MDKNDAKIIENNINKVNKMMENHELAYGLVNDNIPITLNDLIRFCKAEGIDFDSPLLLECPDGYFPLAYYHNAINYDANGEEYKLGLLAITDGEF